MIHHGICGCFNKKFQLRYSFNIITPLFHCFFGEIRFNLCHIISGTTSCIDEHSAYCSYNNRRWVRTFLPSLVFPMSLIFFQKLAFFRINFPGHHLFYSITWVLRTSQILVAVISFFFFFNANTLPPLSPLLSFLKTRTNFGGVLVAYENIKGFLRYFETKTAKFVSCLKKGKYPIVSLMVISSGKIICMLSLLSNGNI